MKNRCGPLPIIVTLRASAIWLPLVTRPSARAISPSLCANAEAIGHDGAVLVSREFGAVNRRAWCHAIGAVATAAAGSP